MLHLSTLEKKFTRGEDAEPGHGYSVVLKK